MTQIESLEQSENPFATVILAHLMTRQTAGKPQDRCQWKLRLLRPMYARGMSAEDVRSLFRVLDWMIELPDDLALQFEHELMKIEQENPMPYVTSSERRAIARGMEKGIAEGMERGLLVGQIQLLQRMLGQAETGREEFAGVPLDRLTQQRDHLQSQLNHPRG